MPSKYTPYGIDDLADFKVWRLQSPNAHKLLKEIIFRWRGSSAKVKGKPGRWAVYPILQWAEWAGLSSDQTERGLRVLSLEGLIQRERHRWAGIEVRAFIQPTKLALQYAGRPADLDRLLNGVSKGGAGNGAGSTAGISAGTDYTSLPSTPIKSSKKKETILSFGEGKGKAATEVAPPPQTLTPQSPPLPNGSQPFPVLKGKHEKAVQHPSLKFPNWPNFSSELKAKIYATYENHVSNWYKGKGGKAYAKAHEWSEEEIAQFSAELAAWSPEDDADSYPAMKPPKLNAS